MVSLVKNDLVGIWEIAEMLGISRQRVHAIAKTDDSFPEPRAQLHAGLIWNRNDIESWVRKSGRNR
jgi:predicted DNA-binding transcriptional regulator AlpA